MKTQEASVSSPSLLVGVSWRPGLPPSPPRPPLQSWHRLATSAPCSQPSCSVPAPTFSSSSSSSSAVRTENAGNPVFVTCWRNISVELWVSECWWMFVWLFLNVNDCHCVLVELCHWSVFSHLNESSLILTEVGSWFRAPDEAFLIETRFETGRFSPGLTRLTSAGFNADLVRCRRGRWAKESECDIKTQRENSPSSHNKSAPDQKPASASYFSRDSRDKNPEL